VNLKEINIFRLNGWFYLDGKLSFCYNSSPPQFWLRHRYIEYPNRPSVLSGKLTAHIIYLSGKLAFQYYNSKQEEVNQ